MSLTKLSLTLTPIGNYLSEFVNFVLKLWVIDAYDKKTLYATLGEFPIHTS